MHYLGLVLFSATLALGAWLLMAAIEIGGLNAAYLYGFVLVAGSLVLLSMSAWGVMLDVRKPLYDRKHPRTPMPGDKDFVPTPEQEVIFALQLEMVDHYKRAMDELELFECGHGHEHASESEKSFRIAISACQRIAGKEGEVCSYSSEMMLYLANLLKMQDRDQEARGIFNDIIAFYQQASQRPEGGGHYWYDWNIADDASRELAEYERAEGNETTANALEEQGRNWVARFAR